MKNVSESISRAFLHERYSMYLRIVSKVNEELYDDVSVIIRNYFEARDAGLRNISGGANNGAGRH